MSDFQIIRDAINQAMNESQSLNTREKLAFALIELDKSNLEIDLKGLKIDRTADLSGLYSDGWNNCLEHLQKYIQNLKG